MELRRKSRLAAAAVKGDTKAFSELYGYIYKQLYYYALTNLNNSDDAADAVQDAVLDAFGSISKLKSPRAFDSWMFRILCTKIKQKQKEYAQRRSYLNDADTGEAPIRDDGFGKCEILEELAGLSEAERLCITLHSIAGYKTGEIAEITGIAPSTVRSYISRGRKKMRIGLKLESKEVT